MKGTEQDRMVKGGELVMRVEGRTYRVRPFDLSAVRAPNCRSCGGAMEGFSDGLRWVCRDESCLRRGAAATAAR